MVEDGDIARDNANATASSFHFLKQSRRTSRRKSRNKVSPHNINNTPPEKIVLLRRNIAVPFSGFGATVPGSGLGRVENEKRVRDLQMERERYLMSMGIGGLCSGRESSNGCGVVCEECSTGRDGGFHLCVYDAVTVGFRSTAGPIARPVRGSG